MRKVLDAHAKAVSVEGRDLASACGLMVDAGGKSNVRLRVTDARGGRAVYDVDRWE